MTILESEMVEFERKVKLAFGFLESKYGLSYKGCSVSNDDPRDAYVVAKYRENEFRIDVVWDPFEMVLAIRLRLENDALGRREKFVHLEPFLEYVSGGVVVPVVPQVYFGMSGRRINSVMERRSELFKNGLDGPLVALAKRLEHHLIELRNASVDVVRGYHSWFDRSEENGVSDRTNDL